MKPGSCRGWKRDLRSLPSDLREVPSLPTYQNRERKRCSVPRMI